jgi:hypothetical protein
MAMELIRFLGGALILMLPGVLAARVLSLGSNLFERSANGCSLGLAAAVYLASLLSHFDLRWSYPAWAAVGLISVVVWALSLRRQSPTGERGAQIWMLVILAFVAVTRFAFAIPHELPAGSFDPRFHLILARQIQLTHHAIDRWPFIGIGLDYPTGSHVLLVTWSNITGLPLYSVFKDLIPLLGVLTTAQLYVLARRMADAPAPALSAAAIYGLWTWYGSIDYYRWGGLPNELAMLLFIAMLSLCLAPRSGATTSAIAVTCAAMILVHHHVMVTAAIILALILVWEIYHGGSWRPILFAGLGAIVLDAFFIVPYLLRIGSLHSTRVLASEQRIPLIDIPGSLGWVITGFATAGIILLLAKKTRIHPWVILASLALLVMYFLGEYVIPAILGTLQKDVTFFTPSRFLADLNYFLPILAASALLCLRQHLRLSPAIVVVILALAPVADWKKWSALANLYYPPPQFVDACRWIGQNTPPNTIVYDPDPWSQTWTTYLCWRQGGLVPVPISEPAATYFPASNRIPAIVSGQIPPDSPDMNIVEICDVRSYTGQPILWQGLPDLLVVQLWPNSTSSSSEAVTPAPKLPGPPPASAPASP